MVQNYFIAGGSGFVGSHLVEQLIARGDKVTVADLVPLESAIKLSPYIDKISYKWKSASDLERKDFEDIDHVIYLAAQADVPLALSSPRYTFDVNIMGLVNVLEVLRSKPNTKLIYMSTKNVYGTPPPDRIPIVEDETLRPTDPYGASKAAADLACQSYARAYNMPIVVFRSAGVFGPRSRLNQVIPTFIRQALNNKPITVQGDGSQSTDYNYVGNLVDAIMSATEKEVSGIYNIAYGQDISILKIAQLVMEITGSESSVEYAPWRPGEKGLRLALSIEKAKRELHYSPKVNLREGIQRTVEWLKEK